MASSRGTTAYGAIMLALTLVIMAAIVGLLVLMVYLCTNIAYKFIPDKAKKNVKRMFTRKKVAGADDEPSEPGIKRGRSVVDAEGFSTMRRFDSTFGTTDPHEAFKPPADATDAPAEPETEREGAGDAGDDASDEASVH